LLCAGLSALAAPLVPSRARAGLDPSQFTAEEVKKLDSGQLVLRPKTQVHGGLRLMGGSSWQVISASPEVVWRALLDTPRYTRMMPRVLEARLISASDNQRTVFMRQGQDGLLEASYYLKVNVREQQRDITFTIDEHKPHELLKAAWGFYTVRPYRDGKTLLAYGVMADISGGWLIGLMRDSVQEWMLRTPWMIKRFLEGSGRKLYG
jgi:ribosome-associated toxin RatA of RatAB toxin-antitoxin module